MFTIDRILCIEVVMLRYEILDVLAMMQRADWLSHRIRYEDPVLLSFMNSRAFKMANNSAPITVWAGFSLYVTLFSSGT